MKRPFKQTTAESSVNRNKRKTLLVSIFRLVGASHPPQSPAVKWARNRLHSSIIGGTVRIAAKRLSFFQPVIGFIPAGPNRSLALVALPLPDDVDAVTDQHRQEHRHAERQDEKRNGFGVVHPIQPQRNQSGRCVPQRSKKYVAGPNSGH